MIGHPGNRASSEDRLEAGSLVPLHSKLRHLDFIVVVIKWTTWCTLILRVVMCERGLREVIGIK